MGNPAESDGVKKDVASISASSFKNKYFIYSLEWTPNQMIWKINNQVVKTQTTQIPDDELYVVMNSGVLGEQASGLPARMEVDWVRCFQTD